MLLAYMYTCLRNEDIKLLSLITISSTSFLERRIGTFLDRARYNRHDDMITTAGLQHVNPQVPQYVQADVLSPGLYGLLTSDY